MSKTIDKWTDPELGEVELVGFEVGDHMFLCRPLIAEVTSDYDYGQAMMRHLAQLAKEREGKVLIDSAKLRSILEDYVDDGMSGFASCQWLDCEWDVDWQNNEVHPHSGTCPLASSK